MNETDSTTTPCWIYRSSKKEEMYIYLSKEEDFGDVPEALMKRFGTPILVMELVLHPDRNLAREDVSKVINNLKNIGYHLQMPPNLIPDMNDGETI